MRRSIIVVLTLLLALTGCAEIATTGPVEEVPVGVDPRAVDIAPEPPAEGIAPVRLVDGFMQAMADPAGGYSVARQYLTPEAAASWEPTGAAIVRGEADGDEVSVTLEGDQVGSLDEVGRHTAVRKPLRHDFGVQQVEGQWRISNPPDGLLLSPYLFARYYRSIALYFMSRSTSNVVPDPIHVPESLVTPKVIVEALLNGPSPAMQRGVVTEIPDGVTVGADGATIDASGIARVDLDGLSPLLSDDTRRRLGAQLLWSLTAMPRITGLVLTSGGQAVTLPGANADGVLELAGQQGYQVLSRVSTSDLFGVRYGIAGRLAGASVFERLPGLPSAVGDLAVSIDGTTVALLDDARSGLSIGPVAGDIAPVETGLTNMSTPQFVLGSVWVLGDGEDGRQHLISVDRNRNVQDVSFTLPERIVDFSVSPTQARIALVLGAGEESMLGMASVISNGGALTHWHRLPLTSPAGQLLTDFRSVSWFAESSVAVVATGVGGRSVFTTQLDGSLVEEVGPVFGEIAELTGMSRLGGGSLAVRTDQDVVWRYEARTRWTRIAENVSAIAFGA